MIALIAAYEKNRVIGKAGRIPWKIKGEQKRFRELTTGNVVIMGRKTFEEIGRALPGRETIIISRTMAEVPSGCIVTPSLREAIEIAGDKDIYVSGGAGLYQEAMEFADRLYITRIDMNVDGDTYFPEIDERIFLKTFSEVHEGDVAYTYVTYERK